MKFLEKLNLTLRIFSENFSKSYKRLWYQKNIKPFSGLFFLLISVHFLLIFSISSVNGDCVWLNNQNHELHEENSNWLFNCMNCSCVETVPICNPIQCKYQQCELGKLLMLKDNECCPQCLEPMHPCNYTGHLIQVRYFIYYLIFYILN
jgi:hypothetical protein